ncbi:MAG: flagellar biosynthesis protein FliQ [Pseudomonadota bacterium]
METAEVLEVIRDGIYVLVIISAPVMITALVVGLIIAVIQALTQIQEATLTFVPKVLAMLLVLVLTMPFIIEEITGLNNRLFEKIVHIE